MKPDPHPVPPPVSYRIMQAVTSPVLKVLGLSCRSAFNLCNQQMDRELSKTESIRLRIHLMMCGLCRHLPAQFTGIRKLIQTTCQQDQDIDCGSESLSAEAKTRIAERLKNECES